VRVRVKVRIRVSENTFKYTFGQTSIRESVLDPFGNATQDGIFVT